MLHPSCRRPALLSVCFAALALACSGCPASRDDGAFDLSGLPDGAYQEAYEGKLAVEDYSGPVSFTVVGGEFFEGLSMNEAGQVSGTPEAAGEMVLSVFASGMKQVEDFTGEVRFTIAPPAEAFLGYEHSQVNNMLDAAGGPYMTDIWLRVTGGGTPDLQSWTINPGLYLPGPNGTPERGKDYEHGDGLEDDVRIGDVAFEDLEFSWAGWSATIEEEIDPPDYPSRHIPEEGDDGPPRIEDDGEFIAGVDAGEAEVTLSHPVYGTIETRVLVIPPDWCPVGESEAHGEGACEP